jgi:hypothetical protein
LLTRHDIFEELHQAMTLAVLGGRQKHLRRHDVARLEAGVHLQQFREAAGHQTGAHEQDQREGDLDDDEPFSGGVRRGAIAADSLRSSRSPARDA